MIKNEFNNNINELKNIEKLQKRREKLLITNKKNIKTS